MQTRILFLMLFVTTCLFSTIINVPVDQPTIQDGIVAAATDDTVLVAEGTYFENIDFIGKAITVASNFLIDADPLHIENTIINGSQPEDPDYGSCVRFYSNEDNTSIITGFTLTEGTGSLMQPVNENVGGGIHCVGSSPKIISNIVRENSAHFAGGIGAQNDSSPIIMNNVISYNTGFGGNAGLSLIFGGYAYLEGNIISNNTSNTHCGGIIISDSSPTLVDNIISDNTALSDVAGGIIIQENSSPVLQNNIICNNTAATDGGGLWLWNCTLTPTITNCTIYDNVAAGDGSQIYFDMGGELEVINSIIGGDTSNESIYFNESTPTFDFCDFYNSDGPDFEGEFIPPTLGAITGFNLYGTSCDDFFNIYEDPLLAGTGDHPFSLLEDSPCIDTGIQDTTGLKLPLYDIIGNDRIADGRGDGFVFIDMGPYELPTPNGSIQNKIPVPDIQLSNYPNPFNPTTTISFTLNTENTEDTELAIYNLKGQKVKQLVSYQLPTGQHAVIWNGTDDNNKSVSSGIYFYKLITDNFEKTKKMILMK